MSFKISFKEQEELEKRASMLDQARITELLEQSRKIVRDHMGVLEFEEHPLECHQALACSALLGVVANAKDPPEAGAVLMKSLSHMTSALIDMVLPDHDDRVLLKIYVKMLELDLAAARALPLTDPGKVRFWGRVK